MEISSIVTLLVALFGGGVLYKLIELFFARKDNEKTSKRNEVVLLREDVERLAKSVYLLREEMNLKLQEIEKWTLKFFTLKLAVRKIIVYLRANESTYADSHLHQLINEAETLIEEDE